ncbi:MAG TPA: class I SAM-dependent methyltransferase [Blastocatellia bacterium]|nr:class I SAM-dependent methyltransferase [Blastocatellia bacterium]
MKDYYSKDLAFIHDVGYGDFALKSAPGILEILRGNGISEGLVVDLGCGSGIWAEQLTRAGYQVLGIDISKAMIAIAKKRAPLARFQAGSLFKSRIPACNAVTCLGECINYLFDQTSEGARLRRLFDRVYDALAPGGVFVFDIAEPGQVAGGETVRGFNEGEDWVVLVEKREDRKREMLSRRIICFRKAGDHYRRADETHRLRLYRARDIARDLRRTGFRVRVMRGYGEHRLSKAHAAFVARKLA